MTDPQAPTAREREDWTARLIAAATAYETGNRRVVVTRGIHPDTGIVVRVDDKTPFTFPGPKAAALRIEAWLEAP